MEQNREFVRSVRRQYKHSSRDITSFIVNEINVWFQQRAKAILRVRSTILRLLRLLRDRREQIWLVLKINMKRKLSQN